MTGRFYFLFSASLSLSNGTSSEQMIVLLWAYFLFFGTPCVGWMNDCGRLNKTCDVQDILYESIGSLTLHGDNMTNVETMTAVATARDAVFRGKIAATIVSAIKHTILPDVWLNNIQDFKRLMVGMHEKLARHLGCSPSCPLHSSRVCYSCWIICH